MYHGRDRPASAIEERWQSDEDDSVGSLDSDAEEDEYDATAYAEAMQWAEEKETVVYAQEQKLRSDI
jgi:hypothetical protein